MRIAICGATFLGLFGAVGRRAYQLQVGPEADRLRGLAEEQHNRDVDLPPRRGRILDRNGAELASTADVDSIYCNPRRLGDKLGDVRTVADRLARILRLDRKELAARLGQRRYFAWIKRKATPDEVEAVKALGLPGMAFLREPRRFYPNRMLAATVMGHAGTDGRGLDGVELSMDKTLRGQISSVQGERDALGRELFMDGVGGAGNGVGSDVILTIDRYLSFITERAIAEAQERHHARAVIAVLLDPRTGEVLTMASVPSYNPNEPGGSGESGARNRAITDVFEPGSTMKTFSIAAALDAGVVTPTDAFDCQMGRMMVGKYTVHDTHPHGTLSVAEVFKLSSNIGATKIARRLGKERLASALDRFGFGHPTRVGLPGERAGMVRPIERWGDIGFANVSFGQGMTATPLQIAAAMSAIANGGVYHRPRIVARVVRPDGGIEAEAPDPGVRLISEKAARAMTGIMEGVTEVGGTARAAAIDGYSVAGKTGTAQKVSGGHYDASKWVSSFIGFAPAEDPRIALVVMVDEPQGGHLGGAIAAPIFKEIAEQALRYLHVAPTREVLARGPEERAASGSTAASGGHASEADERPGSDVSTVDPSEVAEVDETTQLPPDNGVDPGSAPELRADEAQDDPRQGGGHDGQGDADGSGSDREASSAAGRPTRGDVTVPDFRGLSVAAVLRAARDNGVALMFDDPQSITGVAVAQTPEPGPAPVGATCRVAFGVGVAP
jgi:cell division protein FtsI (penicillin-binding protein 3)